MTGTESGEDWPIFRGDSNLSGVASTTLPESLDLLWTYEAGGAITSSPVISDGRVYFGSDDQALHCASAVTGEPLWKFATDDLIEAPALVAEGLVFIGSNDTFFYALDAQSGELRWKAPTMDKLRLMFEYLDAQHRAEPSAAQGYWADDHWHDLLVLVHDRAASAAEWIAFMTKLRKLMGDNFDRCVHQLLPSNTCF